MAECTIIPATEVRELLESILYCHIEEKDAPDSSTEYASMLVDKMRAIACRALFDKRMRAFPPMTAEERERFDAEDWDALADDPERNLYDPELWAGMEEELVL